MTPTTTPPLFSAYCALAAASASRFTARVVVTLLSLAMASWGNVAHASIMIGLDLPAMVQQADHIAVVEVESVKSAWDERHERIFTTVQLKVIEKWKTAGVAATERLTVVQPGGTVGDIRMTVTGLGTFVPGERSLVFLRGPAERAQVVGMTQGKRAMKYQAASRTWLVAPPDLRQAHLVARPPVVRSSESKGVATPSSSASPPPQLRAATSSATFNGTLRERPVDEVRADVRRLLEAARP